MFRNVSKRTDPAVALEIDQDQIKIREPINHPATYRCYRIDRKSTWRSR
jgi:hypothetical protein